MNGTEIKSHSHSRLPQTVGCVVYPAGWRCLTLSADINSALDRSITRIGSSKCRRNGKVLTSRTLRNPRLQDAATKVGVRNDSVKVELLPKCSYVMPTEFLNPLIFAFQRHKDLVMPPRCTTTIAAVWTPWIHRLQYYMTMLPAIHSPLKYAFLSLENNLVCCRGLLFIISHQFPVESDLCDNRSGCRTDFHFQPEWSTDICKWHQSYRGWVNSARYGYQHSGKQGPVDSETGLYACQV